MGRITEPSSRPVGRIQSSAAPPLCPGYPGHISAVALLLSLLSAFLYIVPLRHVSSHLWGSTGESLNGPSDASKAATPRPAHSRVVFVVTAVGKEYNTKKQPCRESQLNYTWRNGYDFVVVTEMGGTRGSVAPYNSTSPWFQKYIAVTEPWAQEYDYLVAIGGCHT